MDVLAVAARAAAFLIGTDAMQNLYFEGWTEALASELEVIARSMPKTASRTELFGLAWDIKQVARKGTPSEGI